MVLVEMYIFLEDLLRSDCFDNLNIVEKVVKY